MTICIAAICKYKSNSTDEAIVFCTDHMLTIGSEEDELGQFEQTIEKYQKLTDDKVCLLSGNPLLSSRLYANVNKQAQLEEIAKQVYENMVALRVEGIKRRLALMNLQIDDAKQLLFNEIKNPFAGDMMKFYHEYSIQTGILLLGFSNDNKAQIYQISERSYDNQRDVNFSAIGSGAMQALNTLLFQRQSKNDSLVKTIYAVYKAKRNSEVARGVGKETDLMILHNSS